MVFRRYLLACVVVLLGTVYSSSAASVISSSTYISVERAEQAFPWVLTYLVYLHVTAPSDYLLNTPTGLLILNVRSCILSRSALPALSILPSLVPVQDSLSAPHTQFLIFNTHKLTSKHIPLLENLVS